MDEKTQRRPEIRVRTLDDETGRYLDEEMPRLLEGARAVSIKVILDYIGMDDDPSFLDRVVLNEHGVGIAPVSFDAILRYETDNGNHKDFYVAHALPDPGNLFVPWRKEVFQQHVFEQIGVLINDSLERNVQLAIDVHNRGKRYSGTALQNLRELAKGKPYANLHIY